MIHAKPLDK